MYYNLFICVVIVYVLYTLHCQCGCMIHNLLFIAHYRS